MRLLVSLASLVLLAVQAEAQARPFVFSVTTTTAGISEDWTVHYDVGFAERTADPFGYEGLEQRVGIQGSLGAGFTLLGQLGLGVGDTTGTSSTQEAEGGAKLFVGPSVRRAPSGGRLYASLCGGPIFYATRSDRTSLAPRPLGGSKGFTVRLSLGLAF